MNERLIVFEVVDRSGTFLPGARVSVSSLDHPLGSVVTGPRPASISIREEVSTRFLDATIDLIAKYRDIERQASLKSGYEDFHRFVFDEVDVFASPPEPEARCPNGTTGRPCVVCEVGQAIVKICA